MPDAIEFVGLASVLRFVVPSLSKDQWAETNSQLKETMEPTHFGLANNVISPQDAA